MAQRLRREDRQIAKQGFGKRLLLLFGQRKVLFQARCEFLQFLRMSERGKVIQKQLMRSLAFHRFQTI